MIETEQPATPTDLPALTSGPTWEIEVSPSNFLTADVQRPEGLIHLCAYETCQGHEASILLTPQEAGKLSRALNAQEDTPKRLNAFNLGWSIEGDTLTILDLPMAGLVDLTPALRTAISERLTYLTGVLARPVGYAVHRDGDRTELGDDQRRLMVRTDDAGVSALIQLIRSGGLAESYDLRRSGYHERLHFKPGKDGALTITRIDAHAFMEDLCDHVTTESQIVLGTRSERLTLASALRQTLSGTPTEHEQPADELWSER